jgi:hypothetical protein
MVFIKQTARWCSVRTCASSIKCWVGCGNYLLTRWDHVDLYRLEFGTTQVSIGRSGANQYLRGKQRVHAFRYLNAVGISFGTQKPLVDIPLVGIEFCLDFNKVFIIIRDMEIL